MSLRPSILDPFFAPANTLPGVGPKIAPLLDRLLGEPGKPTRVMDLLFHVPTSGISREMKGSVGRRAPLRVGQDRAVGRTTPDGPSGPDPGREGHRGPARRRGGLWPDRGALLTDGGQVYRRCPREDPRAARMAGPGLARPERPARFPAVALHSPQARQRLSALRGGARQVRPAPAPRL